MSYTYSKIASYTVGSGGTKDINFLAIPQNYTDLKIVISARQDSAGYYTYPYMYLNGNYDNYTWKDVYAESSTPGSQAGNLYYMGYIPGPSATANTFGNAEYYFPNYSSNKYKSMSYEAVSENNSSTATQWILDFGGYTWQNTAPITSIGFYVSASRVFSQYTTITIYGIKAEV